MFLKSEILCPNAQVILLSIHITYSTYLVLKKCRNTKFNFCIKIILINLSWKVLTDRIDDARMYIY